MTNKASSFPAAASIGPLHRHGGRIDALGELPIHALGDDYTVVGNGTVLSLPALNAGVTVALSITGTPTFKNSARLICPNGVDYVAGPGDLAVARSAGDGVWRLFVSPASGAALADRNLSLSPAQQGQARSNIGVGTGAAAVKSDQTTATSATVAVVPAVQQNHPSAVKAWFTFSVAQTVNGVCTLGDSYGITSVTRNATGDYIIVFSTAFANANYGMSGAGQASGLTNGQATINYQASAAGGSPTLKTTTQVRILTANGSTGGVIDYGTLSVMFFGTQ